MVTRSDGSPKIVSFHLDHIEDSETHKIAKVLATMKGEVVEMSSSDHYGNCDMGKREGGLMQPVPHLR
jgi:hypothetical protein